MNLIWVLRIRWVDLEYIFLLCLHAIVLLQIAVFVKRKIPNGLRVDLDITHLRVDIWIKRRSHVLSMSLAVELLCLREIQYLIQPLHQFWTQICSRFIITFIMKLKLLLLMFHILWINPWLTNVQHIWSMSTGVHIWRWWVESWLIIPCSEWVRGGLTWIPDIPSMFGCGWMLFWPLFSLGNGTSGRLVFGLGRLGCGSLDV